MSEPSASDDEEQIIAEQNRSPVVSAPSSDPEDEVD